MDLNTSHPLYPNLKFLFCVDESNNPVDLVTPSRVFTPHANSVRGSGPWGRHFGVRRSGSTTTYGTALDAFRPANNTGTLLVVTHSIPYSGATTNASLIGGPNNSDRYLPRLSYSSAASGVVGSVRNATSASTEFSSPSTTAYIGATPRMWTFTRNSTTAYAIYVDATAEATGTSIGTDNTAGLYNYIGGTPGSSTLEADIVWIAWFDAVLTPTQIADLYASLGANNTFALVESGAATPVTFSGSVANQTGTEGAAFSLNLSTYFSGSETPFAYSVQAGTLPAGLSLNSSTGVISGTPTTAGVSSGIVVRATDATPDTADSNAFTITINAAGDVTPPTLTSPDVTATGPHAITATVTTNEAGGTLYAVLTTSATAPSVAQIKAGQDHTGATAAGAASLAVELSGVQALYFVDLTAATTYYAHFVQTDAAALDSSVVTSAAETTEAAGVVKITTAPIKNNAGAALTSLTIAKVAAIRLSDMTLAATYSNVTTHATTGVLVLNGGSLVDGVDYLVVTSSADGLAAGVRKYTALES